MEYTFSTVLPLGGYLCQVPATSGILWEVLITWAWATTAVWEAGSDLMGVCLLGATCLQPLPPGLHFLPACTWSATWVVPFVEDYLRLPCISCHLLPLPACHLGGGCVCSGRPWVMQPLMPGRYHLHSLPAILELPLPPRSCRAAVQVLGHLCLQMPSLPAPAFGTTCLPAGGTAVSACLVALLQAADFCRLLLNLPLITCLPACRRSGSCLPLPGCTCLPATRSATVAVTCHRCTTCHCKPATVTIRLFSSAILFYVTCSRRLQITVYLVFRSAWALPGSPGLQLDATATSTCCSTILELFLGAFWVYRFWSAFCSGFHRFYLGGLFCSLGDLPGWVPACTCRYLQIPRATCLGGHLPACHSGPAATCLPACHLPGGPTCLPPGPPATCMPGPWVPCLHWVWVPPACLGGLQFHLPVLPGGVPPRYQLECLIPGWGSVGLGPPPGRFLCWRLYHSAVTLLSYCSTILVPHRC